jgi:hypothetical protein
MTQPAIMGELPCIRCGAVSKPAMTPPPSADPADWAGALRDSPPSDALLFLTYGNYGSTLFDSQDSREYLLVVICDGCVRDAGEQGIVLRCQTARRLTTQRDVWEVPGDVPT